jgi:carboxyl-terminal processing protease
MKKILFLLLIIALGLSSCKKEFINNGVTPEQARDTLYYIMKQVYYWYDLMPSVIRTDYSNPYELLEAMRYKELDRWSFVADYQDFMDEMNGSFVGHGFRIGLDESNKARIAMIYKSSPLYALGVRRGWIVRQIKDTDVAPTLLSPDRAAYSDLIGPSTAGYKNKILFEKPDGSTLTITSAKASITINPVILYDTIHLKTGKVAGHLVYESFIEPPIDSLKIAFAYFKANNITELILDLRYNSGGYLDIAQSLATYIAGNGLTGTAFGSLTYNDKCQFADTSFNFTTTSYPLNISRVVFITARLTASASEAVINGIAPHMDYVSIGDTTDGKPMGMNAFICGYKYIFWPITFKIINSEGTGDYFEGLYPDKPAIDDLAHDFNDRNERCLSEAILYLETGSFSAKGNSVFRQPVNYSEKPSWTNNAFLR